MTLPDYFRFFHPLSDEEYTLLTKNLKPKSFAKGEYIITPGDTQKELYFIKSGVQMSFHDGPDKPHVIAFTYPPGLCAIPESFSMQVPSRYFLTCLSDTETEYLSYDDLQKVLDLSPGVERLFRKMTEFILAGMINRHIELHSLSIEERYTAFCQRSPHLLHSVPHKYIASYLGMDATNFSKLFNRVKF